jgi:hypothetical protein
MSKYIKLDLEAIRRDFPEVWAKWDKTHEITPRRGTSIILEGLKPGESVIYGDGKTFHFLLTKR